MTRPLSDLFRLTNEKAEALCNEWGEKVYAALDVNMPAASGAIMRVLETRERAQRCVEGWEYKIGNTALIGVSPFDPPPPHTISEFLRWWRSSIGPGGIRAAEMAQKREAREASWKLGRARRRRRELRRERKAIREAIVSPRRQLKMLERQQEELIAAQRKLEPRIEALEEKIQRTEAWVERMGPPKEPEKPPEKPEAPEPEKPPEPERRVTTFMGQEVVIIEAPRGASKVPKAPEPPKVEEPPPEEKKRPRGRPRKEKPPKKYRQYSPEDFASYRRRTGTLKRFREKYERLGKEIEALESLYDQLQEVRTEFDETRLSRYKTRIRHITKTIKALEVYIEEREED